MRINVQGMAGGHSASSLLCTLIETLVELKCQLWRKSVEKRVKILTRDSFSIRNRADSWTEATHGNKCGCLLTAVKGGGGWQWQPQDPIPGGVSPQSLSSVPEKHWNGDCWTEIPPCSLARTQALVLRAQATRRCQWLSVCSPWERLQEPGRKRSQIKTMAPN